MKAITLTQPWATLVAIGAKRIETRSWTTNYRGALAIHAAKGFPMDARMLMLAEANHSLMVLTAKGYTASTLPRGCIVAICELVSVQRITRLNENHKTAGWKWNGPDGAEYCFELTEQEFVFGDYTTGRYAWMLHNVQLIEPPIPAKGALGLWEFNRPT